MLLFSVTTLLAFLLSLSAAMLADAMLTTRIPLIGDFIGLVLSHNPGIAFGLRLPPIFQELFIFAALLAVCVLAIRTLRNDDRYRIRGRIELSAIGYGLIIGGALGNIIDRIGDGLVTDFFQVGTFPVFNVADSCITVGVVFVLAEMIRVSRRDHHSR